MNLLSSTHLFSLWEFYMKLLLHTHLPLMVWLKEKIELLLILTNAMFIESGAPLNLWG